MKYTYEEQEENFEREDTNLPKVKFKQFTYVASISRFMRSISWAVRKIKDGTLTVGIYKDNSFCPQHWRVPLTHVPFSQNDKSKAMDRLGICAATSKKNKVY